MINSMAMSTVSFISTISFSIIPWLGSVKKLLTRCISSVVGGCLLMGKPAMVSPPVGA